MRQSNILLSSIFSSDPSYPFCLCLLLFAPLWFCPLLFASLHSFLLLFGPILSLSLLSTPLRPISSDLRCVRLCAQTISWKINSLYCHLLAPSFSSTLITSFGYEQKYEHGSTFYHNTDAYDKYNANRDEQEAQAFQTSFVKMSSEGDFNWMRFALQMWMRVWVCLKQKAK